MNFFRNLWQFIKSRKFFTHLGIYLLSVFLFLWLLFKWLDVHTGHGDFVEVPDFTGVKIPEIKEFAANFGLRDTIIDSIYDTKKPHGAVVSQDPEPKSKVKHNRTIYLYVNSYKPQSIKMPNLREVSQRQAVQILESYGLKVGKIDYKPGQNYVLEQFFKGVPIDTGKIIPKGSRIDLWVGRGDGDAVSGVPDLIGMGMQEALNEIVKKELSGGSILCPECKTSADSNNAHVWKQYPLPGKEVSSGSSIDIFLTLDSRKWNRDSIH